MQKIFNISKATINDATPILELQHLAYQTEAKIYNDWTLPPLTQTIESLKHEFATTTVLKAVSTLTDSNGLIIGSVRACLQNGNCEIGRLIVHPDFQRRGVGSELLRSIEACFAEADQYTLFTGDKSNANIRLYERHGYHMFETRVQSKTVSLVHLQKRRTPLIK